MAQRGVAWAFIILISTPGLAGCTLPWDREDRWRLDISLGVLVASREGIPLDDTSSAVQLAVAQLEAANVGTRITVHREIVETGAVAAFDRLLQKGAVAVVAAVPPDEAKALVARSAQQKRVLFLATPSNVSLAGVDTSFLLQVAPEPDAHAGALARLMTREGAENVVILRLADPFMALGAAALRARFEGNVTDEFVYPLGNQGDTVTAAQRACRANADAVAFFGLPADVGWAVRAIFEQCPGRLQLFAGPTARDPELVASAGEDLNDKPVAAGLMGVEPAGGRPGVFQALFQTDFSRVPRPFAAEAYDAVLYGTLAAFASKGEPDARPVRTTIRAADIQPHLIPVTEGGVTLRDIPSAFAAAKEGDDLNWAGYAHDFSFGADRRPLAGEYVVWEITSTGGLETTARSV